MTLQTGDIGKVVHYRMDGYCVPALITKIYPESDTVDLAVLQPELKQTEFFEEVVFDEIIYTITTTDDGIPTGVLMSKNPDTGYWHIAEQVI